VNEVVREDPCWRYVELLAGDFIGSDRGRGWAEQLERSWTATGDIDMSRDEVE
jgi:hypothetical protein